VIPTFGGSLSVLVVPVVAGITALLFCVAQSGISPGALSQGKKTNMGLTIFTVVFSIYFTFVTPLGVGVYWILRNIFGTVVIFILDKVYNPKRLAPEAIEYLESNKKTSEEIAQERQTKKVLNLREKSDVARFKQAKKGLVFYALSGGQYKYYKTIIEYILENSEITIHYLTNDPDDAVFKRSHERLLPYYVSQRKTTMVLLKLDAKMLVTTVPDLQVYHMKRSIVRDDIEYVYVQHGLGSTHFAAREEAHDHFDTIFCVGEHQVMELRRHEEIKGLAAKNLVKSGYGLYDQLVELYRSSDSTNCTPKILIAPSWQQDNILDSCIEPLLEGLFGNGYNIIIRPHPQYVQMFSDKLDRLKNKYAQYVQSKELIFDIDFLSNENILTADIVITDWSNIAFEFSYCGLKPSIFINTPAKILNPSYEKYEITALEILLRDKIGQSIDLENVKEVNDIVTHMLKEKDIYTQQIKDVVKEYLYYPGRSGEAGGKYIIRRLKD
jgi:YidC/Oxa1 family membrane protein insertase